ncbi:MAG TPA: hypothetical protein VEG25_08165 [Burkholderiales bacterium]|nr:hypothetical protein [Burkholderiales bacterium]
MTKQMTVPIVVAVLLALSSSVALAKNQTKSEQSENCMKVRCWSQIDTNHDNLIEPQEWIKYEQTHPGPLAK